MIENKYEIEKTNDRGYILWIDEKPSICPFCPPVMVPGQIPGTASMMRMPCSTQCPLAWIDYTNIESLGGEKIVYHTMCGSCEKSTTVTVKEESKQNQSGILKSL